MSRWQNKRRAVMETDAEMAEFYIKRSCQQQVATESQSQQEIVCDSLSDAPTKVAAAEPISVSESTSFNTQENHFTTAPHSINDDAVLNPVSIPDDFYEVTDNDSMSCKSSFLDELEINEVHSTVYLPLLSIAFYLGSRLTKSALSRHLKILQMASAIDLVEHASVHMLLSDYENVKFETSKIWVCYRQKCDFILKTKKDEKEKLEKPLFKQPCGHNYLKDQRKDCYVLFLPIEKQLKYFIEHHGLPDHIEETDPNFRSDVNTGSMYRKLREEKQIDDNTITVQVNLDGAVCFQVSQYGFWPFMAIINEAQYKIRRGFVILLSLWYGNKKPPAKAIMDRPLTELQKLEQDGFTVNGRKYRVVVLIATTDTVARPIPWNCGYYNGEFGCNFCMMEGVRVPKGRGSARVYPEPKESLPAVELRTLEQHRRDMKLAIATGNMVNGIKGETPFVILTKFDYVKACVPEYMHGDCMGVAKLFLKLFFTGKKSQGAWHIASMIPVVNARLMNIKPPYEITRSAGAVDDLPHWKASMFRSFFLYYFVLLEDILPLKYFEHFCLFCYGMNVLLQEKVAVEDVKKCDILFKKFVNDTEVLYGVGYLGINVHFLTHLSQCVMDWGCLWSYSTFIPEWFNGELLSMKHGSQAVAEQMANNYLLKMAVRDKVVGLEKDGQVFPPDVREYLHESLHLPETSSEPSVSVRESKIKFLGAPKTKKLNLEEEIALMNYFTVEPEEVDRLVVQSFPRLEIQSTKSIFTTNKYKLSPKRSNHCALLPNGMFFYIESILLVVKNLSHHPVLIGREMGVDSKKNYVPAPIEGTTFSYLPGQTMKLVGLGRSLIAVDPAEIITKCVIATCNDISEMFVVTALVNNFETD